MRGRERDHRRAGLCRQRLARGMDADRRMRIDEGSGLPIDAGDLGGGLGLARSCRVEFGADLCKRRCVERETAGLFQALHEAPDGRGIAAIGLEQQPLEFDET